MENKDFDSIQRGEMEDALMSPQDIEKLIAEEKIKLLVRADKRQRKRIIDEDFSSFDVVKNCIFIALRDYRSEQWKQKGEEKRDYQSLMQTSYEDRFSQNGLENIWFTLAQWNMNSRGAKLEDKEKFNECLLSNKSKLDKLSVYSILDFCNEDKLKEIRKCLLDLYTNMNLAKQETQIVTFSKTLHFLHPQLMIPIDRNYTLNYFHNYVSSDWDKDKTKQIECSIDFHKSLSNIYNRYKDDIDNISLKTKYPVTKLLDNMLIGFSTYRSIYIDRFNTDFITFHK